MDFEESQVEARNGKSKRRRLLGVGECLYEVKLKKLAEELGRSIKVFINETSRNDISKSHISDEPDDFYEFTQEDYIRLMANRKEEKFLKTKKIRDAESAARRAKITKAVIRVLFPDDYVVEATFQPTETISVLMDLLTKIVARPDIPFYIYTTPPKKKITDLTSDFYSANLIPRAIVRFAYDVPEDRGTVPFLTESIKDLSKLHEILPKEEEEIIPTMDSESGSSVLPSPNEKPATRKPFKPKWMKM